MSDKWTNGNVTLYCGDALEWLRSLPDGVANCCITSPPYYGLRNYNVAGQIGLEESPEAYVAKLVEVFREVRRVLRDDGTLWLNLGDSYAGAGPSNHHNMTSHGSTGRVPANEGSKAKDIAGLKPKDLIGIPWRVAFALQADGWWLRQDIIWAKPNPMPESVTDRCTKSHEYLFLLAKNAKYYYDAEAVKEESQVSDKWHEPDGKYLSKASGNGETSLRDGFNRVGQIGGTRNRRSVWTIRTKPYSGAHFAVMPEALVEPCILAGCPEGGLVIEPFCGSGTVPAVAQRLGRRSWACDLNADYIELAKQRVQQSRNVTSLSPRPGCHISWRQCNGEAQNRRG